ncbi:MAG: hypothetical protein ACOX24_00670 [Christensenellales bacterium]|jgi:hypothetical protein
MSKKYKEPFVERKTKAHDPYVKTNYRDTLYKKPEPKHLVPMAPVVFVGEWFKTLFVMLIPLVNLIAAFVWAFNKKIKVNETKRNWAKASVLILILFYMIAGGAAAAFMLLKK